MKEYEEIIEKMKERDIVPRISRELQVMRWFRLTGVVLLIGVGIVWWIVK